MQIEVEWEVNIKSGFTQIDIKDLGVKNKKEWNLLDNTEQRIRINKYLIESDQHLLKPLANDWDII